jgi:hypothetical protein
VARKSSEKNLVKKHLLMRNLKFFFALHEKTTPASGLPQTGPDKLCDSRIELVRYGSTLNFAPGLWPEFTMPCFLGILSQKHFLN